ncbi:BT4734/BF3469 family protein [Hymenobacter baengnokdamensis]|uniref:BT4734/BF3469 family protein n=1 Tax=Hymenobacter baengnokdamensis TaxID=2615203 RepID=UPI0012481375|nr:BT4734/BF3469 family protein [Hymenobacter baengnokdamensis]
MLVSFYPKSMNPEASQALQLPGVLAGIRDGRWREQVLAVRGLDPAGKAYSAAKKALPGFTVSGTFTGRKAEQMAAHSGFLCLDIDAKLNAGIDLAAARRAVEADSYTYACFTSAGGLGWAVVVRVPGQDHKGSFRALAAYYLTTYGLTVDPACKDASRLRFVSYDPGLYLNEQAATFEETLPDPTATRLATVGALPASTWRDSARGDGYGQRALELACDKVRAARDGEKRTVLNKMAFLCGGYIGAGFLTTAETQQALEATISSREVEDLPAAFKTIAVALKDGQQKPVLPPDLHQLAYEKLRGGAGVDAVVAGIAASQGLPVAVLEAAVWGVAEEQAREVPILAFWQLVPSTSKRDAPPKLMLQLHLFRRFLTRHGFRKHMPDPKAKVRVVRLVEQVVHESSRAQLKDFVLDYLASLPFGFDGTYRTRIEELVQAQHRLLFDEGTSEFLPSLSGAFQRDTVSRAYLFYRNAVVVATKDGPELLPYRELAGLVWAEQLIEREFSLLSREDIEKGEFFLFLFNLAGKEQARFKALRLFLGYYLHGYKDPSNPKVGVLLDEGLGPEGQANGGTGKSLLFEALRQLVPIVAIDGRGYDPRNSKELQEVKDSTRVVFFDDWAPSLPFERLFSMATGTLVVDRHYLGKQSYPYAVSPKFGITTNGVLTGQGGSHDRRRFEVEIAPYYGPHRQPRDEFGHNFFDGWDAQEWARFDALMVLACCEFLGTGGRLASPVSVGLEQRRLLAATSAGFVEFMDAQPRGVRLYRTALLSEFRTAEGYDERGMTPHRFGSWLNFYKELRTDFQSGQDWEVETRGQRWILLAQPVTESTG